MSEKREILPAIVDGTGPYLQLGCICEKVLEGKDGTLSLIQIVDQVTQTASGVDVPDQMPPFVINDLKIVVALKSGKARGRYAVRIRPEDPSGSQLPAFDIPVHLEGSNKGINLITEVQLAVQEEGLYWFDVLLVRSKDSEALLTRIPLDVRYRPHKLAPA